jgi:transcriptional regulator with XRE-family HTH domain
VAETLGLPEVTVEELETGDRRPSAGELMMLAGVFEIDIHELVFERSFVAELLAAKRRIESPNPVEPVLQDRYVALAVLAYDLEILSERELADCLEVDIVTARAIYQGSRLGAVDPAVRDTGIR